MSEHIFSHQLLTPNKQIGQQEASVPHMLSGQDLHGAHQQISSPNEQIISSGAMTFSHGSHSVLATNMLTGKMELKANDFRINQFGIQNKQLGAGETVVNYTGPQQLAPTKRKVPIDFMSTNPMPQRMVLPNKTVMEVVHRPWLQQLPSPNMKNVQIQSMTNIPGLQHLQPPLSRKVVVMDSAPKKSGPQQLLSPKNQTAPIQSSSKVQAESFGPVRSKLRESLATALALVTEQHEKSPNLDNCVNKPATSTGNNEVSKSIGSVSMTAEGTDPLLEKPKETLTFIEGCAEGSAFKENSISEITSSSSRSGKCDGNKFQLNLAIPEIDAPFGDNFFGKDDLLQGNGLSWAIEVDMELSNANTLKVDDELAALKERQKLLESPETLAFKIETELFKLFGGVNKKYKEKARSLLFNLKDPSNPELREKVMSCDIPPERLCNMTADELASKELSEWRIAKAEELAQMVVLPDNDVDMRRLVKKTHKGELEVEYEQDDSVFVEVSAGATTLPQIRPKSNKKVNPSLKYDKTKVEEDQEALCTLTIPPNEEADLMLDEFKDADFLPPIVSLDEFMESLDSEPPFENLPGDADKSTPSSVKDQIEVGSKLKTSEASPKDLLNSPSEDPDKVNVKKSTFGSKLKTSESSAKDQLDSPSEKPDKVDVKNSTSDTVLKSETQCGASKGEQVWEGSFQLNPSTSITVIGFFKSGEKTSTKDWPSVVEIKGRVRLDKFEKYIHELPLAKSRAVMVTHFTLKQESAESDSANLSEVVDSYILEERVGFAEPSPGVEVYICPTHPSTLEMLKKHLPKHQTDPLDESTITNNGLIGVVVSRKLVPHSISPKKKHPINSSSGSRRHHAQDRKDVNVNVKKPLLPPPPPRAVARQPMPQVDDDDDVPPGFGPGAPKDDDDLPEFNFSSAVNRQPAHQMRELVHKYGQSGKTKSPVFPGVAMKRWTNNDDDDDIPEWQPQSLMPQQQTLRPHMVHPHQTMPLQPQMNTVSRPPFTPQGYSPVQGGKIYGNDPTQPITRRNGPRSRDF